MTPPAPPPAPDAATTTSSPYQIRPIPPNATHPLRHAVLWPDRPLSYVRLDEDAAGWHFGAFGPAGPDEPVSVLSLFRDDSLPVAPGARGYRFRKFATAAACQGRGAGSALLRHVVAFAAAHREGDADADADGAAARVIWCDARQSALGFYERFGFRAEGDVFYKGDVPYLKMSRLLA